jgi:hypothetical protein
VQKKLVSFSCYLDTTNLKTPFSYLVDIDMMVVCVFSKIGVYAFGVVCELIYAKGFVIAQLHMIF